MFIFKNNLSLILIFALINVTMSILFVNFIPLIAIYAILLILLITGLYYWKKEFSRLKDVRIIKENDNYRKNIKKIYKEVFEPTEFKNIFDKKIFTIIEMLSELTEKNIKGVFGGRVHRIINESLRLYVINLESASKMIKASKVDLDFKDDIKELMSQNKIIINNLKDFITKLIRLNVNDNDFVVLINEFSKSMKNLESIKEIRNGGK